jgi:hypothetical protein
MQSVASGLPSEIPKDSEADFTGATDCLSCKSCLPHEIDKVTAKLISSGFILPALLTSFAVNWGQRFLFFLTGFQEYA